MKRRGGNLFICDILISKRHAILIPGKCREENDMHTTLRLRSVRTIFYERERHDVTTT
jgi:hypothetical protein